MAPVDSDADYGNIGGATTDPYNDTGAPSNGDGRYYRCITSSTGASNSPQTSTTNRGYRIAAPTVITQAAINIEDTTATGNGNITATGNGNCSAWGICWNTTGNPTTADNTVGGSGAGGTGAFTASLTSLPTGTTIHTKAYATSAAGTSYGAEEDFLTKPAAPTNVAATENQSDKVVVTWTKSTGATGYKIYEGVNLIDTVGDVATFDHTTGDAPTITAGSSVATDGTSTAHVALSLSGTSVANGATYTYKVVALNATGDSDDSNTDTGYRLASALTYQWNRSSGDSDEDYSVIGGATSSTHNDTTAPAGVVTPGTTSDGTSAAYVTLSLAGESVADGAGRYFTCTLVSTNADNTPQTASTNRGYRTTGSITYQWQRSAGDSDDTFSVIGGATTDPYNDTGAPANGDGRYYYCEVAATGTTTQDSTHDRGFRISLPTVTTQAASNIEDTTATGHGNITDTGDENCDIRGIVWDLSTHGDPGNVSPAASDYANDVAETPGPFGAGAFTRNLTSLPTGDTIYARAYAHNSAGYSYGAEINFLTKPAAPTNVSATDGTDETKVVITWTKSTGATDYHVWRDAVDLGAAGDVATFDDTEADAGTITAGTASASDGTEVAHVVLSLAGESANNGTTHTYKVVASNATGDSADSATNTGYRGVGALTYQWQRSAADSDADYGNIAGGTTDPYNDTGAPANGDGRYFRCVLDATGAAQQISSVDRGYRGVLPTVTVQAVTDISYHTATGNGNITSIGTDNCDKRGFVWDLGTHGDPGDVAPGVSGYAHTGASTGDFGTGAYTYGLTELSEGELYYVRAYVHNNAGYDYSDTEETFLTKPDKPTALQDTDRTSTTIDISWTKGSGAQKTMVRYRTDQYPTSTSDGIQAYFNTGTSTTVESLSSGQVYYFRAWSYATEGGKEQYSDLTSDITAYTNPGDPSALDALNPSATTIDLSWAKGTGSDTTMIRRKVGSYPDSKTDGQQAYFDTGVTTQDSGLDPITTYYYRAWAYDSDSGYYSDSYSQDSETTLMAAPTVTNDAGATNITDTTARLRGEIIATGGENPTVHIYWGGDDGGTEAGSWDHDENLGIKGEEVFFKDISDLIPETLYYYRCYAVNSIGDEWADSTAQFTTGAELQAPTNFTAAYVSDYQIDLSWDEGVGALNTLIMANYGSYPIDRNNGYRAYYGSGTSCSDTLVDLQLKEVNVYYRAWSEDGSWSNDYAETTIGGVGMTLVAQAIFILGLSGLAMWRKNIILYTGAFLCLLLFGLSLIETSWMWGLGPLFLSAFMMYQSVRYWWRRRSY
ncbi:hypothetical protein ES703_49244 [subsurface metagenome]